MHRIFATIMLAALMAPAAAGPVLAQQTGPSCATVADDAGRLACYDSVFRAPTGVPAAGEVVLQSSQLIAARPSGRKYAQMVIACREGRLGVSFSFAGHLLSETSDEAAISFQVQQTGSVVRSLPVSDGNTSIGFRTPREADAFLETLEGGDNVVVRITPPRQRSLQVQFIVRGHEDEIAAVRAACVP